MLSTQVIETKAGFLSVCEMEPEEYIVDSDSDVDVDEDGLRDMPSSSSSSPPSSSSPSISSPSLFKSSTSTKKLNKNKSMFKNSRRLSGMPNMILNSMTKLDGMDHVVRYLTPFLSLIMYFSLLSIRKIYPPKTWSN